MKQKYKVKMIFAFSLLNVLCILLSSIGFYIISMNNLKKNYSSVVSSTLSEAEKNINRKVEYAEVLMKNFLTDKDFYAYMTQEYSLYDGVRVLHDNLLPKGRNILIFGKMHAQITLYIENTTIPEYYVWNATQDYFNVKHISRISDKPYYRIYKEQPKYLWWSQVDDDAEKGKITLFFKTGYVFGGEPVGLFEVKLSIDEILAQSIPTTEDQCYYQILNRDGELIDSNFSEEDRIFEKITKNHQTAELENGWLVRIYMPFENITKGQGNIFYFLFLLSVLLLLVSVLMVRMLSGKLYEGMNSILEGIEHLKNGEYDYQIKVAQNDEYFKIAEALNGLSGEIRHLIDDVYENMLQKQTIEYQMLRTKVNPHFLSNVFNLIVQLAESGANEKIVEAAKQSAVFYRKNLAVKKDCLRLLDELNVAESYLKIVDLLKPGMVKCRYQIDPETERCMIPSFIIQPILENSVNHAMTNGSLQITVSSETKEDILCIRIVDNGVGMNEEQISELFKLRDNRGYGLYSIRERIRFKYRDDRFGISVSSGSEGGTEVLIKLPTSNEYEQEEYDV